MEKIKHHLHFSCTVKIFEHIICIFIVFNSLLYILPQCQIFLTLTQPKNDIAHMTLFWYCPIVCTVKSSWETAIKFVVCMSDRIWLSQFFWIFLPRVWTFTWMMIFYFADFFCFLKLLLSNNCSFIKKVKGAYLKQFIDCGVRCDVQSLYKFIHPPWQMVFCPFLEGLQE